MSGRVTSFDGIIGHSLKISYFKEQIANNSLPHFIILEGEEGLGKNTIAELCAISLVYGLQQTPERDKAIGDFIVNGHNTSNLKKYAMAVGGGKDVAKDVLAEFDTTLTKGVKVIILDECHGMSDAAQDVLLGALDTGRIPNNLYVFALTTEITKMKSQLVSRAVSIHLARLAPKEMLVVLREECFNKGLNIQGGDATLNLIAEWAEYKPRTGLSLLSAFSSGSNVPANLIKELIGYLEVSDVLPLVVSLCGSFAWGLSYISEIKLDTSFIDILIEILKIKVGGVSYRLRIEEVRKVKEQVKCVPEENLCKFVYIITGAPKLTRAVVTSAFIQAHCSFDDVEVPQRGVLVEEQSQRQTAKLQPLENEGTAAPSLDELLANSSIVI